MDLQIARQIQDALVAGSPALFDAFRPEPGVSKALEEGRTLLNGRVCAGAKQSHLMAIRASP
jgi:hypothetical protein